MGTVAEEGRRTVSSTAHARFLLVNNYSATGIGDFGLEVRHQLGSDCRGYLETRSDGRGQAAQLFATLSWPDCVLTNLGLTAWGRSGLRNLAGYLVMSARIRAGRRTVVLVHNLIEALDTETSGYAVSGAVRAGAHEAVRLIRGAQLVTFSQTIDSLLRSRYNVAPKLVTPIPCLPARGTAATSVSKGQVIIPGYLSPYKGHERLPDVRRQLPDDLRWIVVGGPHRILMKTSERYRRELSHLNRRLAEAHIEMKGWVPDAELDRLIGESTVALLPYSSTQGASAMLSRIASVGTPIVASRLPEFEWLERLGAGIHLVPPTTEGFARGMWEVLGNPAKRAELASSQAAFAQVHSWESFTQRLQTVAADRERA